MNNYYIPTPKPDLDEDGLPCETKGHDCLDFIKIGPNDVYTCVVCKEQFTDEQVDLMYHPEPPRKQPQFEPMQGRLFPRKEVA